MRTCAALLCLFQGEPIHSGFTIEKNGHGEGRDLVVLSWKTREGRDAATVRIPVTGLGKNPNDRIGPVSILLEGAKDDANAHEFDTREWQWWKNYPRPVGFNADKYTRLVPARGGADKGAGGVRAWTRYVSDDVETTQEWFFGDLPGADEAAYDCLITVKNSGAQALDEYGQFFASYTKWHAQGQFYWAADGTVANYPKDAHLNFFVVAKGSVFEKLGRVPHCPRGGGKVKAAWRRPVSISSPNAQGFRHVILVEEAFAAAVTQGMGGSAQDYVIAPPGLRLDASASFRVHVRHHFLRAPADGLAQQLEKLWDAFSRDHATMHRLSRPAP